QTDKIKHYLPHRTGDEHLQILAVTNFKGGSGKTTTSVHLAQYLALHGYRVLAIDLDPQASLWSLLGFQPEFDLHANETLYGAVRYDYERRSLSEVVRKEVLQLYSHPVIGWLDALPGTFGLRFIQVAAI